jgi:hypothetical protein
MKYKAIVLCLLLALPVGLIATLHSANALVTPALFVTPPIDLEGPCQKGKTFTIDVWLLNMEISNGGNDIYAFDFTLDWSTIKGDDGKAIIGLVNDSIAIHSPWPSGGYFTVANETSLWTDGGAAIGYPYGDYHLAITAMPPKGTGLFDVNQSIVTLTFVVLQDACYPADYAFDGITKGFLLSANISGDGTTVIPLKNVTIEGGVFEENSFPPNIELTDSEAVKGVITEKCVSHETDVQIELTNITKVYGYGLELYFDVRHLEVDLQKTTFKPGFPPPYDFLTAAPGTHVFTDTAWIHTGVPMGDLFTWAGLPIPNINATAPVGLAPALGTFWVTPDNFTAVWVADGSIASPAGVHNAFLHFMALSTLYGTLDIVITRPSEKPTICGTDVPVFDVIFHTIDLVDTGTALPSASDSNIGLLWAYILSKSCGPDSGVYSYIYGTPTVTVPGTPHGLIYGGDLAYDFDPSKYDLNLDCVVDIQDLMTLLPYYNKVTPGYDDLFLDVDTTVDPVDIFDFVAIAKHFGPVDP